MDEIQRRYWTMGQVVRQLKKPGSAIRFHLKALDMDYRVLKAGHKNRMFLQEDIDELVTFQKLLDLGFTLKGAATHIKKANEILTLLK